MHETEKKISLFILLFNSDIFVCHYFHVPNSKDNINMNHPCHKEQLANINRIEGQLRGISKMIDNGTYCVDILNQIKAAKNSLQSVEAKILKTHLKACVKDTLSDSQTFDIKVEEILKILKR